MRHRLADAFRAAAEYEVIGEPVSLPDAAKLAREDPYQSKAAPKVRETAPIPFGEPDESN